MKTSWVIGVMMFYLLIIGLEMMATGGVSLGANGNIATSNQSTLMTPDVAESGGGTLAAFTGAWAIVTGVAVYLRTFLPMLALWSPTVFSGYLLWVWWGVCFPVDVALVFGIVGMVRGVHSA